MRRRNPVLSVYLPTLCVAAQLVTGAHAASTCAVTGDGNPSVADVQSMISQALGISPALNDLNNDGKVNAVDVQIVINAVLGLGCSVSTGSPPTVTGFNPQSGPAGTLVTVSGGNFGTAPQVSMPQQGGGTIAVPLSGVTANSLVFVIPSGAASGPIAINNGSGTAFTSSAFTVTPPSTFSLTVVPASANLIQGQSVAYAVQVNSTNGFDQLAQLTVTGVPAGVTASFAPASVSAGQTGILTLTAPATQAISTANLSITASATVSNLPVTQSAAASLAVVAPTTSLLGRTVVANPQETPLAGVTVSSLGLDGNGNTTGCTGHSTVADAAGNFALTNLPQACTGPQLFSFNGTTATSPPGQYAGVNLVFTLTLAQVTASPVLVHLPRIDNVETFNVVQNSTSDQTYSFTSIPGLSVTAYAGTTLTMPDGTQPNPFPLAAVQVPVDRLPDLKPNVPTMIRVFIVAFQPANATANQPVAVSFPNVSNTAPGTDMTLMTLDPTHGTMVPYGTGAVSADGTQVVPDMDPSHPGHRYGLVHFDWHGQMPPPNNQSNPCPMCQAAHGGDPVDLSSGLQVLNATDIFIAGARGGISVQRIYRTLTAYNGAFGPGHEIQYAWQLNTGSPNSAAAINLISPDGNQFLFSRQTNLTLTNSSMPSLQGAVMTTSSSGSTTLRYPDGTVYLFQPFAGVSYLSSITDRNGNTTTFTVSPLNASTLRITKITDPVGRSLNLTYNSGFHVASVTDPIGRTVSYTYNSSGTLATVTDPNGGVTTYQYDSQNRMSGMTDARGVQMFQDSFDSNGRVLQQVRPDTGVFQFSYTVANPLAPTSPVIATAVTDPRGNQTTYRFNVQGFLTDVTDALGQMKSFTLSPGTNLLLAVSGPAQCDVCGPPGDGNVSYTYDSRGNILTSADALGNTSTLTYEPVFNEVTSVTDALGHATTLSYDTSGNVTSLTDPNGHATQFSFSTGGLLAQVTGPAGNTAMVSRDSFGDPTSMTDPLGNTTAATFDAVSRPLVVTDPFGRRSTFTYDALDRVTSFRDPRGNTTSFSYDAVGNLLSVTDPRGNTTAFTYDSLNRLQTRTSPLQKTETYQYDLDGNNVQYTDRRGQVSHFQFDALNRIVMEQYQDGSSVTRSYDPYSRPLTVNDSQSGVFAYTYDASGSLLSQNEPNGSVQYTRDPLGRVATRQVAGQSQVTYSYDAAGNLLGSNSPAAGIAYSYDVRNLPTTFSRTNGVTSAFTFDPKAEILSIVHARGSTPLNTQTYAYDASGSRTAASNDLAQSLIAQAAAATVDQANELLSNGQTTYTHDLNGNRLTETSPSETLTYAWDSRNRLASITDSNGNVTAFKYDPDGNLIETDKSSGGNVTTQKFVLDGITNVVSLTDASGLPVSVLTGNSVDSHYASVDSAGNVAFGIDDALGSMSGITNGSATLTSSAAYDPYGQTASTPPVTFPFAFTGRVPITHNIVYFRARFLDTATGRFLSEDPADFGAGDPNLYAYAQRDPVDFTDPQGLAPSDAPGPSLLDEASDKLWNFMNTSYFRNGLDFAVGAEDDLTFHLSTVAYRWAGLGGQFRECSGWFKAGGWFGFVVGGGIGAHGIYNLTSKLERVVLKSGRYRGIRRGSWSIKEVEGWREETQYELIHLSYEYASKISESANQIRENLERGHEKQ